MGQHSISALEPEECVDNTAVAYVDFRGLDLPFLDVLEPGWKLTDHVGAGEDVEVGPHGLVRNAKAASDLRTVPGLSVVVCQHRPEST